MPYSTKIQVRNASGFQDAYKMPDSQIDLAITGADALINSMISAVYTLPLVSTPSLIETISIELAKYRLYQDEYGEETQNLDKGWMRGYDWAMGVLDDISKRKIKLIDDTTGEEFALNDLRSPAFYPNDASSQPDAVDSTQPKLTMNQNF